jgi:hypothetical protein
VELHVRGEQNLLIAGAEFQDHTPYKL